MIYKKPRGRRPIFVLETRCRELRARLHWSRERLVVESGASMGIVQRLELGRRVGQISLEKVCAVAHALGASPVDLLPALSARPVRKPRPAPGDVHLLNAERKVDAAS